MAKLNNIGQVFHVPAFRFPRDGQMILKIAFVELWTHYLLRRITFPLSKLPRLHHHFRKESLEKIYIISTRLIAYTTNVRTYPTKKISMKCHLDYFKARFRPSASQMVRRETDRVARKRSSCLRRSCG